MFGTKCSLCNGKLDSRKICKECGLDNSKSEKYYKINQGSCDNLPLTHVHEESWEHKKPKRNSPVKTREKKKTVNKGDGKKKKPLLSIITTLLIIIPAIFGIFESLIESYEMDPDYGTEEIYDPYEYLEMENPVEGDILSYSLKPGQYVVGVHIAPGDYYAEVENEYDTVEVTDRENGIYLYANRQNEDGIYLQDLRLFEGAIVTICAKDEILLETENAQTGGMLSQAENFMKDICWIESDSEAVAGVDFEPGIYDLSTDKNYAYVSLTIFDEDGTELDFRGYNMGTDGVHGPYFRNVVIPEGAVILCENVPIELIPSEQIWTTDYLEYYY